MDSTLTQPRRFAEGAASVSSPPPAAPFFDPAQNAWVLSRYGDVLAALREPGLRQAGPQRAPAHVRKDELCALSQSKIPEWQERCAYHDDDGVARSPRDRPATCPPCRIGHLAL